MITTAYSVQLLSNPHAHTGMAYGPRQRAVLDRSGFTDAEREITSWPGYKMTPLLALNGFARQVGVASIWYKDEAWRFGLESFKALGGAYAVFRVLAREIQHRTGTSQVNARDLISGTFKDVVSDITVTCATDGNHGRSVAWGAQMFGCRCVIYVHENVSERRLAAITAFGAEVVRTPGGYDDAVRRAASDAAQFQRRVVSDTSYDGYMEVPKEVMQGYRVMVAEAVRQLQGERPSHVFVQGGVGGLAAAVCAHLWEAWGTQRPKLIVVEPERADCLYQSGLHGRPMHARGNLNTWMAGLACGEVSRLAWEILVSGADYFMTISDQAALDCMRLLADGVGQDRPLVAGESGTAGLAGLLAVASNPSTRRALALEPTSRALVFGTEGDTDPDLYRRFVGRSAEDVRGLTSTGG